MNKQHFHYTFIFTLFLSLNACQPDDDDTNTFDYSAQIGHIANEVILTTYEDFDVTVIALTNSLVVLESAPNQQNLEAARQAWRVARSPWEKSEGFLFGPVDQQGIDPSVDSWPVNVIDLNAVLNSAAALDSSYVSSLEGTLKGFHTIEWLLFGENGNKAIGDFTNREFEYLAACSKTLAAATHQLSMAWSPTGSNFVNTVSSAGSGSAVYTSQKQALEEIVNGLVTIADEVGNGKINDPFVQQNLSLEESRFSANSKADFADNIRSIQNIWLGGYNTETSYGISSIVNERNASLDAQVRSDIQAAIDAIENIPGTFSTAIFSEAAAVENAQNKVRALQLTLESQVLPLISNM